MNMNRIIHTLSTSRTALILLLTTLLTTTTAQTAWADGTSGSFGTSATWSYDTSTKTLTISGTGALTNYASGTVNLQTDNRPFASYKDDCTTIVIAEGITSIGVRDFAFMNSVTSVSIPASVTSISEDAFYRGSSSSSNPAITFTIANDSQLTTMGICTFMRTKATIDLSGCSSLTTIPTNALYSCTDVTLPNTVTTVAGGGMENCTHVYVAPKNGYSLAVNGTPVAVGSNGKYEVTSLVNNSNDITFAWITPRDLTHATLTLTNAKEGNWYAYQDGSPISVSRSVQDANGTGLNEGTDYTVSITNSSNETVTSITAEDTYTLTVTGTGSETSGYYGSTQTTFTVSGPIALTSETTAWLDGRSYYAEGEVTIGSRATVSGTVTLDLRAGSTLTVTGGIGVNEGNSLTIGGTGSLTATATTSGYAGIGGYRKDTEAKSAGIITINGGTINATGSGSAAGIGGGSYNYNYNVGGDCGTITINGGIVNATPGNGSATAIGLGWFDGSYDSKPTPLALTGSVTINGGQVTASGLIGYNDTYAKKLSCRITLGWTDYASDFIEASTGYKGTVSFVAGKTFQYDNSGTATIVTSENIGSMGGKRLTPYAAQTYTVTFETGEGATTVATQTLPDGYTATRPADPLRTGYRFVGWLNGSAAYDFTATVTTDLTLTAAWEAVSAISYIAADGAEVTGFTQYIPLEQNHTTLDGSICGTWVVDADLTQSSRITVKNNVTLILTDGKTLTAQKGISVTARDNAVLTVLAQSGGTGALTVTGVNDQDDASIGGDDASDRYNCGTVSIYGGRITISGNYMGAGIGGASGYGSGGTINILGGQVDVSGSQWGGHAIGYGYNSNEATATITLGWRNATDYILLRPGSNGTACCKGTVTIASNFLLNGTTTKARWTSESDNNIDGKKLVPDEQGLMDWADVKLALEAGQTVTLTNDVSSESGDSEIQIPGNVNATLDLNGHTLTHGYATTGGHEHVIQVVYSNATLTIRSTGSAGSIAGNLAGIYNNGTVSITNVNFSGFGGTDGNKDAIRNDGGTLSLTDVSITGNTGGGIYIYNNGTLNVAGKVNITGNSRMLSADAISRNVYLESGTVITLTGALTSDSRIGVSGAVNRAITSGAAGRATLANFTYDGRSYICWTTDGSEVQINQDYYMNEKDGVTDLVSRYAGQLVAVRFARSFTSGVASTICLPFQMNAERYETYGTFYKFVGVEKVADVWTVTMQEATNKMSLTLYANTPYLFLPKQTGTVTFDEPLTVPASGGFTPVDVTPDASTYPNATGWTYRGTYNYMKWTTDTSDPDYNAERAAEIGKAYGFAGVAKTGINVGDFVRVASGAKIRPMRCYLLWSDTPSNARALNRGAAAEEELPQSITVRLVGSDGETTAIGTLDTRTGEFDFDPDGWYDMSGRRLSGKPSQKGVYINNGKKVIVK